MKTQRYRIRFSKTEEMRFTGHLDLILTWERTFRRAGLPLSYSEGFNPRPVINLASPLPLGFTSTAEIGDFWLSETRPKSEVIRSLEKSLPPGLSIHEIQEISQLHGEKLPGLVLSSAYTAQIPDHDPDLEEKISEMLNSKKVIRVRKGKEYDLRPLIHDVSILDGDMNPQTLKISLFSLQTGTGRPDEVLRELGIPPFDSLICRTSIQLKSGEKD